MSKKDSFGQKLLMWVAMAYFISLTWTVPYFNWQYAKAHGFGKWLAFGEIVATERHSSGLIMLMRVS